MADRIQIREMQESDGDAVMEIFNHYAAATFAAYPEGPLPLTEILISSPFCSQ